MQNLVIKSLSKSYGLLDVFTDFNLSIKLGKVTAIMGASGVGKSTLLNILSGEITDYQGEILNAPTKISYVFSKDRLVPSLTVFENVKLVLGDKNKDEADALCNNILGKLGLALATDLYPRQLSTGMKKRTNLARAFAYDGDLMLLDEPFANLDIATKIEMTELFLKIQRERKQTAIIVTHDLAEAITVADEIVLIERNLPPKVFSKSEYDTQSIIAQIQKAFTPYDKIEKQL